LEISNIIENNESIFTTQDTYDLNQRIVTERSEININTKYMMSHILKKRNKLLKCIKGLRLQDKKI
jgi:hypothetical protein